MDQYALDTISSIDEFTSCIDDGSIKITKQIGSIIEGTLDGVPSTFEVTKDFINKTPALIDDVIFGKDTTKNIVNISAKDNNIHTFIRNDDKVVEHITPTKQFAISTKKENSSFSKLKGQGRYKYIKYYTPTEFKDIKPKLYKGDYYFNVHQVECNMLYTGTTYFKGMTAKDISLLSFDLETTSLDPNKKDAKILCIGSTYRFKDVILKKVFREDTYTSQKNMIEDWCKWVTSLNPDVITGYNIYLFDIPYLITIADREDANLYLGRDGTALAFENRRNPRKIRKDGSQEYDYHRPEIFGREIIDMWIITLKADQAAKKYDSYALKHIIKIEGLEKEGRTHYDASKIKEDWKQLEKRQEICNYCEDDSEDPIKLWDLMITPFFLITSYLPKPFQIVSETNTGGQINSLLVRSYLQDGWSIPKGEETSPFQGAISLGVPGLYKNAIKWDVSSLYPSIMRAYNVKPKTDYLGSFLKMLEYFTLQRIENKKSAKTTGNKYYDDLQNTQKIFINSSYGALTTPGLNFNDMDAGSSITRHGREILEKSIMWATNRGSEYWKNINKEEIDE